MASLTITTNGVSTRGWAQSRREFAVSVGRTGKQQTPTGVSMTRVLHALRALAIAAAVAAVFALAPAGATQALAQASRFSAEIAGIEIAEKRVTLKASMGQQTLRVAPGVALEAFKPGDKVLVTFGQDGTEPIITSIELIKT